MQSEEIGNNSYKLKSIKESKNSVTFKFEKNKKDLRISLSKDVFEKLPSFKIDEYYDENDIKRLEKYVLKEEIKSFVLKKYKSKLYSSSDLIALSSKKFKRKTIVKEVVFNLINDGLIDDLKYVNATFNKYNELNYGEYFIKQFLKDRGIKKHLIDTLKFDHQSEVLKAQNHIELRKNYYSSGRVQKSKSKIYKDLVNYGFNSEVIEEVISKLKISKEEELANLDKKFKKLVNKYDVTIEENRQEIFKRLINEGYNFEDIYSLFTRIKEEESND